MSVKTFPFVKLKLFSNHQHVFPIFSSSKIKCPIACGLTLFTNFRAVDAMLPITGHLSVRVGEHLGVSPLTEKKSKSKQSTAAKDHMLFCDHIVSIDGFNILETSDSDFHVNVKESLLISRDKTILNKSKASLPLYLFD